MGSSFDSIRDDEEEIVRQRYIEYSKEKAKKDAEVLRNNIAGLTDDFKNLLHEDFKLGAFLYENREKIKRNIKLIDLLG